LRAGDCANRFVDAQEAAIGIDFRNTYGGMFVSGRKTLLLFEGVELGTLERGIRPFAGRDIEKTVYRPDQLTLCIAQRIDVDRYDQRRAVGMFDDALYVAHRLARRKDLGNQRTRDRRSIHFEETDAFPELTVRLTRRWSRPRPSPA